MIKTREFDIITLSFKQNLEEISKHLEKESRKITRKFPRKKFKTRSAYYEPI